VSRIVAVVPEGPRGTAWLAAGGLAALAARHDVDLACLGEVPVPPEAGAFADVVRLAPERPARRVRRARQRAFELARLRRDTRGFDDFGARLLDEEGTAWRWRLAAARVPRVNDWLAARAQRRLAEHEGLTALVRAAHPALVVGMHVGFASATIDTVAAARACGVPVLLLQTAWDVFTGDPCLPDGPDVLGVWGIQSAMWGEITQGTRKNRMFLAGAPYHDDLAGLAPGRAGHVMVDAAAGVEASAAGPAGREFTLPVPPAARAATLRAVLADAAVIVTADPELVLEAATAGVASVAVTWGRSSARWRHPQIAFTESLPGCFRTDRPAVLADRVADAGAFAADPGLIVAMRRHAAAAAYTDSYPAADRIADAADALIGRAGARHHYLRDPIIDVESKQNVVETILPETVAVATRSFDPTMIDSEEQ
jgi:hypothetical protein